MRAIILAAGRGSRMGALTDKIPKCLIELHGVSLLDRQLSALRGAGIRDIAIVTGYRRDDLARFNLVEFYNARWSTTNMVSSLFIAESWLKETTCIVSYSDIFYCETAIEAMMQVSAQIAVSYDPNWLDLWNRRFEEPLSDAETFSINADKQILEIGNKPSTINEIQGQFMGIILFTPVGWSYFKRASSSQSEQNIDQMQMTEALQRVIELGQIPLVGVPYEGSWGELDSASDLLLYGTT